MLTVTSVVVFYLLISTVAVNMVPPGLLSTKWKEDPLSGVASSLPWAGTLMGAWIAVLGSSISIVGANAGIIGSSRTLYALANYKLLPGRFGAVHHKFRTPHVAVLTFGLGSITLVAISSFGLLGSVDPLLLLGSLYNVGALVAYVQAHASLIVTRNRDRPRYRPFKIPLSLRFKRGTGEVDIPILPVVGFVVTGAIWVAVILTHELGRLLGVFWVLLGIALYVYFRKKSRLPLWGRASL